MPTVAAWDGSSDGGGRLEGKEGKGEGGKEEEEREREGR